MKRSLKVKVIIMFSLMSVIPVLVFLNYILPSHIPILMPEGIPKTRIIIFVVLFLISLGFLMLKEIIGSVVKISAEAKIIARGDYSRLIDIKRDDEIGDLSIALNQLTSRIKTTMQELRQYSEKTKDINLDIHKRVALLSGLLQITELISQGEKIETILQLTLDKLNQVSSSIFSCYLSYQGKIGELKLECASGFITDKLKDTNLKLNQKPFRDIFEEKTSIALDNESSSPKDIEELRAIFGVKNLLLYAVSSHGKTIGILAIGTNADNFVYKKEDLEAADIFAKQVSVCIENDQLQQKVKSLQIKDALTGLYNKTFMEDRLSDEIKKAIAYQKPCSLIIFSIDNFKEYHTKFGALLSESVLKRIATLFESVVSDIDLVGRIGDNEFAIVLPARSKKQAMALAEDIKNKTKNTFTKDESEGRCIVINSGVSENPLDGNDGKLLMAKAREALTAKQAIAA